MKFNLKVLKGLVCLGGPAEKAGLHAGDKILQVNGTNVVQSTHTDVVALIKGGHHFNTHYK